ncbi:cell division protein FtsQ/DivIB [Pararhodospirillum photometricum]|uniref:Cell division protein FtsQ n=1 Tax=Pararhodospirillum photometricum DSM 122 TaxID=1150469 RepID=H6SNF1_PARPM|nr:FtsQ-type POTRA domain-containing protein [Pararhodospirillum photometricum]CCG09282.1 Cell division protein FtsQ [Pararhodospirillum photometricum DSM 122]
MRHLTDVTADLTPIAAGRGRDPLRTLTRASLVFLLAGLVGAAYLAARTPSLIPLLTQPWGTGSGLPGVAVPFAEQGMVLAQVSVTGRRQTDARDVLEAVGAPQGTPLLAIEPERVRKALEALPWVAEARVERRLPDRLHIALRERTPLALWQNNGQFTVIDSLGTPIPVDPAAWSHLPLVVGPGAPSRTRALLDLLGTQPELAGKVVASTLVGERRWTLRLGSLQEGIVVRLPEAEPAQALALLVRLDREQGLLSRDIDTIDMRLPDRLVIRVRNHQEERPRSDVEAKASLPNAEARANQPNAEAKASLPNVQAKASQSEVVAKARRPEVETQAPPPAPLRSQPAGAGARTGGQDA